MAAGPDFRIPGLTPFFTSNAGFYRVDTDLVLPQVAPETWTLRIDGMVDRQLEISFAELLRMPLTEADITLVCVSNEVGGTYAGNARWLGVPLAGLLRRPRVQAGAKILTYHVASGRNTPDQLASGSVIKTLEGGNVTPSKMGGTYEVNAAHVVCGNVQTANATVYIIDTVLMPPSS